MLDGPSKSAAGEKTNKEKTICLEGHFRRKLEIQAHFEKELTEAIAKISKKYTALVSEVEYDVKNS